MTGGRDEPLKTEGYPKQLLRGLAEAENEFMREFEEANLDAAVLRELEEADLDVTEMSLPQLEVELWVCKRDVRGNEAGLETALEDARRRGVDPATDEWVRAVQENVVRAEESLRDAEAAHRVARDADASTQDG